MTMLKNIATILLCGISISLFSIESSHALDFEVTRVVSLGPCYSGMTSPALWSSDGSKIAFFSDGSFMLGDTSGETRSVAEIDLAPHRFVWSSDSTILLWHREMSEARIIHNKLVSINVRTGVITSRIESTRKLGEDYQEGQIEIGGPYQTVEGNGYFLSIVDGAETIKPAPTIAFQKSAFGANHILRTGEDALYMVRIDGADSIKLSNKPYNLTKSVIKSLSRDRTHIMFGGTLVRLADDRLTILDTLIKEFPEGTDVCGFGTESFNPRFPEVAFSLACDDGHAKEVLRIGVFDYETNQFQLLDSALRMESCYRPRYAPDGLRIAFISYGELYIMERELR